MMNLFVLPVLIALSASTFDLDAEFSRAVDHLEVKEYEQAMPILRRLLEEVPDNPAVLWNVGTTSIVLEEYELAELAWTRLHEQEPSNWEILPKLVQTYHALQKTELRDASRNKLFAFFKEGLDNALSNEAFYCREQFPHGDGRVYVYEHFEPFSSERAKFYEAVVVSSSGEINYSVSMGSYESTNTVDLEVGNHKPDERLYHYDAYYPGGSHRTLGFYVAKEPATYEQFRSLLDAALERLDALPSLKAES